MKKKSTNTHTNQNIHSRTPTARGRFGRGAQQAKGKRASPQRIHRGGVRIKRKIKENKRLCKEYIEEVCALKKSARGRGKSLGAHTHTHTHTTHTHTILFKLSLSHSLSLTHTLHTHRMAGPTWTMSRIFSRMPNETSLFRRNKESSHSTDASLPRAVDLKYASVLCCCAFRV